MSLPPDLARKLAILADAAKYDASCASSGSRRARPTGGLGDTIGMGICHSFTPDGRCVSLLKILLTNHCVYECRYCVNRASSDTPRARFSPDEVIELTLAFYRRNYIEGLFLSSGIARTPDATMAQLTEVARRLRTEHAFGGYIHLKAAAGASRAALSEAVAWADRVSANIETATQADLDRLAPAKTHASIETAMGDLRRAIDDAAQQPRQRGDPRARGQAGQSTQLVIGATPTADGAILAKADQLYRDYRLSRVYYSAFSPIPDAHAALPLTAAPLAREHRLYQADWLLRRYGFQLRELLPGTDANLPLDRDPKLDWALRHRAAFPVDANTAPRETLLRVPGCGATSVERILAARRHRRLTLADLRRLKVTLARAKWFIAAADHNPSLRWLDRLDLERRAVADQGVQQTLFADLGAPA
jgi:putative DNA modification/repair radical SAM protein